jgi:hypothetical protein
MYNQPAVVQNVPAKQAIYQMDPAMVESLHKMKLHIHGLCKEHMHHPVRVQTIHGQTFEGHIVHIDDEILYLKPLPGHVRSFFNPLAAAQQQYAYNNVILPLVLFNLLTIALL